MEAVIINQLIASGQTLGGEWLSVLLLLTLYSAILILWKFLGTQGLYLYNILAVVIANIQVLKVSPFFLSPEPVALGTLLFSTTFLVSDILTEHHGVNVARKGIILSFLAQIIMAILMVFTLAYPSVGGITGMNALNGAPDVIQSSLYTLFAPSLRILSASLISYFICQSIDVKIFKYLKDYCHKKMLWMRSLISMLFSGLLDNILFSTLAWVIFSPSPVSFNMLIFTYILGTYIARVVVGITSTPVIYLTYKFFPRQ